VLRTAVPTIASAEGRRVPGVERLGKRIVLALEGDLFVVIHLMVAGRLLADRSLSRLLHDSWPRHLDELG
jgi:formamidopyrimidine-DNA glycosylase